VIAILIKPSGESMDIGCGNPFNGRNTFTLIFIDVFFSVLVQSSSIGGGTRKPQVSDSISKYTPPGSFHLLLWPLHFIGSFHTSQYANVCMPFFLSQFMIPDNNLAC